MIYESRSFDYTQISQTYPPKQRYPSPQSQYQHQLQTEHPYKYYTPINEEVPGNDWQSPNAGRQEFGAFFPGAAFEEKEEESENPFFQTYC